MVIIFSIEQDTSTHMVLDWLNFMNEPFVIVYPDNFCFKIDKIISYVEEGNKPSFWLRKWDMERFNFQYINDEALKLLEYLYYETKDSCFWLNTPNDLNSNNKLIQGSIARSVGFLTPQNRVVAERKELIILGKTSRNITKSFGSLIDEKDSEGNFLYAYTQLIDNKLINRIPEVFFPSLVQEYIDKEYEIRTFFLRGECFSMAIFSQNNEKTSVDFRHYDSKRPNRNEPIKLPNDIEEKLRKFVEKIGTNCGSFDLIQTPQGEVVFLEFNPLGQLGMVSTPCGYNLEKRIAQLLKKESNSNKTISFNATNNTHNKPLGAYNLEKIYCSGVDACYYSNFYECKYGRVANPYKPLDLMQ